MISVIFIHFSYSWILNYASILATERLQSLLFFLQMWCISTAQNRMQSSNCTKFNLENNT